MKLLRYVLINIVWFGFVYLGTFGGIVGFANIAIFGAWFLFIVSTLLVTDIGIKSLVKANDSVLMTYPQLRIADAIFDLIIIFMFVYTGFFVTAVVYTLHMLMVMSTYVRVSVLRGE